MPRGAGERGVTLIEVLAVIGIIAVLTSLTAATVVIVYKKGRDAARKASLSQIGRLLAERHQKIFSGFE